MWVIHGGEQSRMVDLFVDEGVIAMGYPQVPDAEILTRSEIRKFLAEGLSPKALDAAEEMLSAFVRELQVGDSVLMPDPQRGEVIVGTITGGYEFDGAQRGGDFSHRRTVEWIARHPIGDLPAAVQGVARQKVTLQQHRDAEWAGYLVQVREHEVGRDPKDRPARSAAAPATRRRAAGTARATTPRTPKAVVAQRTCPSCFLQTHPDRFRGDVCMDCAE